MTTTCRPEAAGAHGDYIQCMLIAERAAAAAAAEDPIQYHRRSCMAGRQESGRTEPTQAVRRVAPGRPEPVTCRLRHAPRADQAGKILTGPSRSSGPIAENPNPAHEFALASIQIRSTKSAIRHLYETACFHRP